MKQDDDNGQWFYDRLKRGCETPISNSAVIYFLKQLMKNKSMATAQFLASAAFLVEELDTADEKELKLMHENAELKAALKLSEKRLGLFLNGDTSLVFDESVCPPRWVVSVDEFPDIIELCSGGTPLGAIDNAIKGEK